MECYTFYCMHTPVLNSCGSFRASSLHSICCCPRANKLVVNDHMIWSTSIGEPTNLLNKQLVHKHILEMMVVANVNVLLLLKTVTILYSSAPSAPQCGQM